MYAGDTYKTIVRHGQLCKVINKYIFVDLIILSFSACFFKFDNVVG